MTEQEIELMLQENSRLKAELQRMQDKEKGIHNDYKQQLSNAKKDQALTILLASFKTRFDDLPAYVKDSTLKEFVASKLAADSAELSADERGQLLLRKKDGTNFFGEDHRLYTPATYLERVMNQDNILISADYQSIQQPNNNTVQQPNQVANKTARGNRKSLISSLVDESLSAFSTEH